MEKTVKILILTNIPSPYRVDFFNELGKQCELTVLFEKRTSNERDKDWDNFSFDYFKGVFLHGKSVSTDMAVCPSVIKYLKSNDYDKIIVMDLASPTGMLAIHYMKKKGIKYWIESDGGFAKSGAGFKERIKKYFITGAEGYFSTSDEHDRYYITYGAQERKIYRYPFTSIKENEIASDIYNPEDKKAIRKKLNIREKKMILAVGQFIHRKGYDVLLKAMIELNDTSLGLYLVGGEATEEYLNLIKDYRLKNIHFISFKNRNEIQMYYKAADIFVHPTREDIWGLVINEALACGLPVITSNQCGAGLEMVSKNNVGKIIKVDDINGLKEAIKNMLNDNSALRCMSLNAIELSKKYTIEKMVERHFDIFTEGEVSTK